MELKCSVTTVFIPVHHETAGIDKKEFSFQKIEIIVIKRTLIL